MTPGAITSKLTFYIHFFDHIILMELQSASLNNVAGGLSNPSSMFVWHGALSTAITKFAIRLPISCHCYISAKSMYLLVEL